MIFGEWFGAQQFGLFGATKIEWFSRGKDWILIVQLSKFGLGASHG